MDDWIPGFAAVSIEKEICSKCVTVVDTAEKLCKLDPELNQPHHAESWILITALTNSANASLQSILKRLKKNDQIVL